MDYLIGYSFGHYHIIERLGEGGMATTFKAYDTHQEKNVALIVVRVAKELSEDRIQQLEEVGKRLKQLSHPNLVAVLDFGMQKNMPYLVTQYENVHSLKHHPGLPLPYQKAAALLAPVAHALEYLHHEGMIHGDVKPSNILITAGNKPLLADVGATRVIEIGSKKEVSSEGLGFGTPAYMAPEQVAGGPVDQRADIYALGIILFELITAQKPHDADTPLAVLAQQVHDPIIQPSKLNPSIPEHVEQVIFKATAKNPDDRYQTMALLASKLEELSRDEEKTEQMIFPEAPAPQKAPLPQPEPARAEKTVQPPSPVKAPPAQPVHPHPAQPVIQTPPPNAKPPKKFPWAWVIITILLLTLCAVVCLVALLAFGLIPLPGITPLFPAG